MNTLLDNELKAISEKIRALNENFSDNQYHMLVTYLISLFSHVLFADIESWLLDLYQKEKWPIINGILAFLYLWIDDLDNAREKANLARKAFPDTEVWSDIIRGTFRQEFEEQYDKKTV